MDEERTRDDFELGFLCLFCGGEVKERAADFCELTAETGAGLAVFVCHAGCLRERAHAPERFPDLEAPVDDDRPRRELPDGDYLAAWERLDDVLGQLHEAELDDVDQVRSLVRAVEDAAVQHGVAIEHDLAGDD